MRPFLSYFKTLNIVLAPGNEPKISSTKINELILLWLKNKTNKTPLPSSLNKVGLFVFWGEGRLSLHGDAIIH